MKKTQLRFLKINNYHDDRKFNLLNVTQSLINRSIEKYGKVGYQKGLWYPKKWDASVVWKIFFFSIFLEKIIKIKKVYFDPLAENFHL
jgi:hypothetical protein